MTSNITSTTRNNDAYLFTALFMAARLASEISDIPNILRRGLMVVAFRNKVNNTIPAVWIKIWN